MPLNCLFEKREFIQFWRFCPEGILPKNVKIYLIFPLSSSIIYFRPSKPFLLQKLIFNFQWLKQIQVPIDENERVVSQLVAELVDLIVLTKSKRGPKTLLTAPAMHSIAKQNFKNKNDKNIFLPQTVVDILKGLKNAHFEEDLRKIREEEELERARMTRKIAIKMAPTILNPTNNFASRGSSICSDGPAPSTPSKPILPTIGTAMNFRTLNKNNNTLIYSTNKTINEGTVQRGALKRRCDTQTTGYFLTNNLIYSQQIKAKTTATTNNSNNNNNADPHGYLPSKLNFSENSYLLPSTSSTSLTTSALNGAANTFNNLKNLNRIIRPISIDEVIIKVNNIYALYVLSIKENQNSDNQKY